MSFQVSEKATTCFKVQGKLHMHLKSKCGFQTLTPRWRQQHFTVLNVLFRDKEASKKTFLTRIYFCCMCESSSKCTCLHQRMTVEVKPV